MSAHVFRELFHGGVAAFRFFAQGLQNDVVQVSGERAAELLTPRQGCWT